MTSKNKTILVTGDEVTIYRDGSQTRSFCFVSDLIDALMRLMGSARPIDVP